MVEWGVKMSDFNSEITHLLDNVEFDKKLISLDSESQIKKHFENYNITLNDKESSEIYNLINKLKLEFEKLPDDQLKNISGGVEDDTLLKMCTGITSCISGISDSISKCLLRSTKAKCKSNEKVAQIKADSKVSTAKYMAADHVVGYALVTALALYYIKKRTDLDSKKYLREGGDFEK